MAEVIDPATGLISKSECRSSKQCRMFEKRKSETSTPVLVIPTFDDLILFRISGFEIQFAPAIARYKFR